MLYLILITFILGYIAIAFEHSIGLNKAATALLTGGLCWTFYILDASSTMEAEKISATLIHHLGDISGILFFLLGAMTIVELIDAHEGFEIISNIITTDNKRKLLWIICLFAFFLSAVIDNLTTTIVMITIVRKLIDDKKDRMLVVGMIIIAANAGGAWSPIGDVTTTMLWIGNQVSPMSIMGNLFLPSLLCLITPLVILSLFFTGKANRPPSVARVNNSTSFQRNIIFFSGISIFLLVPVFKTVTHLPPFLGMLLGLGLMWLISEIVNREKDEEEKGNYSVVSALQKIDTPSILFFLGILIAVAALQSTGQLYQLATGLSHTFENQNMLVMMIGLLSAVVDNVPLVAGVMGMYDLSTFPTDHPFWQFLAYCAGTGGSVLIIGSAAGVAAMGMEKIDFFWYLKKISLLALIGYFAGAVVFMMMG
jgi:Na+/H+ antiporter NhaD/arsenite permease-like protein